MELTLEEKIEKLSDLSLYGNGSCSNENIKIISSLSFDEAQIILRSPSVIHTIFEIQSVDILRNIFRKTPSFFQEIMFSDIDIQNRLLIPRDGLTDSVLMKNFNRVEYFLTPKEIRKLEVFIHTIKSPKIFEQLIENKFFQRILTICNNTSIDRSFFENIDEVKLFYNIIHDPDIFNTKCHKSIDDTFFGRKRNILNIFNKVSCHVLLSEDYQSFVISEICLLNLKGWTCAAGEKILVDKETLSLFNEQLLDRLLYYKNIDYDLIRDFFREKFYSKIKDKKVDIRKFFPNLLNNYRYRREFRNTNYLYFSFLIDLMVEDLEIRKQFLDFLYSLLCSDYPFDEENKKMIQQSLFSKLMNENIKKEDYQILICSPSSLRTIFYLKFNQLFSQINYLHGISSFQLLSLNVKHINQILDHLRIENEDELSNIYMYAIKMYMVFGLERTIKILDESYGNINRYFFDQISKLDVSNVSFRKEGKKYLPILNQEFINFLFFREDQNHFREMLSGNDSLLLKNFSYFYNHYDEIKEKCHGNITFRKLTIIFKEMSDERDITDVTPNNYRLEENDILNDVCLGNKTVYTNEQIYKKLLDIYKKMKHRVESSIPYVEGKSDNGYSYQMMKFQDPIAFTLGYKGNCCIRISDIGHEHLLHATLCRNGRILLLYDENHKLAAFSPLKRNGEVLIANSIECLHKERNEQTIPAFLDAVRDIVSISKKCEKEPIRLVCIGQEAYTKPNGKPFPKNIKTPTIYEEYDSIYEQTDCYHRTLDIVYQDSSLNLGKIKYKDPECSYMDPRSEVKIVDYQIASSEEIKESLKVINAIRYENADVDELDRFSLCRYYQLKQSIYNDDWYIAIDYDGNVYGECLNFDSRALEEQKIAFLEMIGTNYDDYTKEHGYLKKMESKHHF